MAQEAWTPGPWRWVAEDHSMCTLERDTPDETEHVLSVTICKNCQSRVEDKGSWEWGRCYTANEANARLISAAPDMAEALDWLLTVAEMTTFSDQYPAECEAARAALARARGDAS